MCFTTWLSNLTVTFYVSRIDLLCFLYDIISSWTLCQQVWVCNLKLNENLQILKVY